MKQIELAKKSEYELYFAKDRRRLSNQKKKKILFVHSVKIAEIHFNDKLHSEHFSRLQCKCKSCFHELIFQCSKFLIFQHCVHKSYPNKNNVSGFDSNISTGGNGNTNVSLSKSRGIINTVSNHSNLVQRKMSA